MTDLVKEIRARTGHQWSNYAYVQSEKVRDIMTRAADEIESRTLPCEISVPPGQVPMVEITFVRAEPGKDVYRVAFLPASGPNPAIR